MKRLIPFLLAFGMVMYSSVNADQKITEDALVEDASQLFIDLVLDKALGSKPSSAFEILAESYIESQLKVLCEAGSPLCAPASCSGNGGNGGGEDVPDEPIFGGPGDCEDGNVNGDGGTGGPDDCGID